MKTCKACSEPKPLDEFWRQAKSKDGRNPRCIPCAKEEHKRLREANPERMRALWRNAAANVQSVKTGTKTVRVCLDCDRQFEAKKGSVCGPCRGQRERRRNRCPVCDGPMSKAAQSMCRGCRSYSLEGNPHWKGGRTQTKKGYVYLLTPGRGYVGEHVLVVEAWLGRQLERGEEVHHRNGIPDDNRRSNLELWVRPHPRGIRASDAVAWAREILTKYDHNLLDA